MDANMRMAWQVSRSNEKRIINDTVLKVYKTYNLFVKKCYVKVPVLFEGSHSNLYYFWKCTWNSDEHSKIQRHSIILFCSAYGLKTTISSEIINHLNIW
jgi:hypothetical protein